jgi:hypothetical protein
VILVAPGTYAGGLHLVDLKGTEAQPITVRAADAAKRPLVRGGANGFQLTDAEHLVLEDLDFEGQTGNGLNVDDGGTPDTPTTGIRLVNLAVRDVGPDGNRDGIKLSGLVGFSVTGCTVERWGRAGSAIDMVGCRDGVVEGCTFRHGPEATNASGVQTKGATRDVVVRRSRFEHAGGRAVNVGGSTGLDYFRPPLASWRGEKYEARAITVEGCTFVGSQAPVAFVGVDGATFRFNTLTHPGRWALRILQETREPGFVPCRNVSVSDNVVVFRSDAWSSGGVNVGPGTEPASFRFARNVWYCSDAPERTRSLVSLPTPEVGGTYGVNPESPAVKAGARALPPR